MTRKENNVKERGKRCRIILCQIRNRIKLLVYIQDIWQRKKQSPGIAEKVEIHGMAEKGSES